MLFNLFISEADAIQLQSIFECIGNSSKLNGLSLNIGKCCVMSFSRNCTLVHFEYIKNGVALKRVTVMRDLGVIFDD